MTVFQYEAPGTIARPFVFSGDSITTYNFAETLQGEQDWLEPQVENIYYHKRPAIQEHNVSANKDMLAIRRRRRQLPFKVDGDSIDPSP